MATHLLLDAMVFAAKTQLIPEAACVLYIFCQKILFCSFVRIPVYYITYGCGGVAGGSGA